MIQRDERPKISLQPTVKEPAFDKQIIEGFLFQITIKLHLHLPPFETECQGSMRYLIRYKILGSHLLGTVKNISGDTCPSWHNQICLE